jgi:hypothetical protein
MVDVQTPLDEFMNASQRSAHFNDKAWIQYDALIMNDW